MVNAGCVFCFRWGSLVLSLERKSVVWRDIYCASPHELILISLQLFGVMITIVRSRWLHLSLSFFSPVILQLGHKSFYKSFSLSLHGHFSNSYFTERYLQGEPISWLDSNSFAASLEIQSWMMTLRWKAPCSCHLLPWEDSSPPHNMVIGYINYINWNKCWHFLRKMTHDFLHIGSDDSSTSKILKIVAISPELSKPLGCYMHPSW